MDSKTFSVNSKVFTSECTGKCLLPLGRTPRNVFIFVTVSNSVDTFYLQMTSIVFHLRISHEGPAQEYSFSSTLSLTSALDGSGWSTPCVGRFTLEKDAVPGV